MEMEKESIKVLKECIILQEKKANDYQNPNSRVKQNDYYPRGISTLADICWAKMLRIISLLEALEKNPEYKENFESLDDNFKDLINYSSFSVSFLRGKIDGQDTTKDIFNKEKLVKPNNKAEYLGTYSSCDYKKIKEYLTDNHINIVTEHYCGPDKDAVKVFINTQNVEEIRKYIAQKIK